MMQWISNARVKENKSLDRFKNATKVNISTKVNTFFPQRQVSNERKREIKQRYKLTAYGKRFWDSYNNMMAK